MAVNTTVEERNIEAIGRGEAPVLEQIAQMTLDTRSRSGLDDRTYILVRLAALVAADGAPASYLVNLGAAGKIGVPLREVQGMLVAIAPIVGSAKVVSGAGQMMRALGIAEEIRAEREETMNDKTTRR